MRVERSLVGLLLVIAVVAAGCQGRLAHNLPPAELMMQPGPGVDGPGPGVIPPVQAMGGMPCAPCSGGACEIGCGDSCGIAPVSYEGARRAAYNRGMVSCDYGPPAPPTITSQISFLGEEGIQISWDVSGHGMFDSVPLVTPGRQDFPQAAIYRLKLANVPGRPGVELYPTLEVAPVTPRTDAYLAHSPVPVQFTEEDFDQVLSGNFVTKVIYLPDPEFQELALAGVETLVSTRLAPGVDPIAEADRRGSILAVVRMGNKDLETGESGPYEPEMIIPAAYGGEAGTAGMQADMGAAMPAGCMCDGGAAMSGVPMSGAAMNGAPMGMPTAGFAPPMAPPNMVAAAPQWGMPMSGTPIGLPGPPHIPLGAPAGLQKHVMKNRTRMLMPAPTAKVQISVKQRPGMDYPRPVNRVTIDETQREPFRLLPFNLSDLFKNASNHP